MNIKPYMDTNGNMDWEGFAKDHDLDIEGFEGFVEMILTTASALLKVELDARNKEADEDNQLTEIVIDCTDDSTLSLKLNSDIGE